MRVILSHCLNKNRARFTKIHYHDIIRKWLSLLLYLRYSTRTRKKANPLLWCNAITLPLMMRCTMHKPFNRVSYRKLNSDIPNVVLFFWFIFFFKKELAIVFSNFLVSGDERKRRQPTGFSNASFFNPVSSN